MNPDDLPYPPTGIKLRYAIDDESLIRDATATAAEESAARVEAVIAMQRKIAEMERTIFDDEIVIPPFPDGVVPDKSPKSVGNDETKRIITKLFKENAHMKGQIDAMQARMDVMEEMIRKFQYGASSEF